VTDADLSGNEGVQTMKGIVQDHHGGAPEDVLRLADSRYLQEGHARGKVVIVV
jgi:hypothetical protein